VPKWPRSTAPGSLLLDDTQTFKNWDNARKLEGDPAYRLVRSDPATRNGFAVFERVRPHP
jgi:hypothetical protein